MDAKRIEEELEASKAAINNAVEEASKIITEMPVQEGEDDQVESAEFSEGSLIQIREDLYNLVRASLSGIFHYPICKFLSKGGRCRLNMGYRFADGHHYCTPLGKGGEILDSLVMRSPCCRGYRPADKSSLGDVEV